MAEYGSVGTHQLNKYLWSKLKILPYAAGLAMDPAPWAAKGIAQPFFPSQQVPEAVNMPSSAAFVVYNYTIAPSGFWAVKAEQVAYIIHDDNEARLRTIHNHMISLLEREDWTAKDVNVFLTAGSRYDFKTVQLVSANGPDNFTQVGGRQGAMVVVRMTYTYNLTQTGLRAD